MPIYPYICSACSFEFDRLQKISEESLKLCPQCGEESLRKKLTAAAFRLKGTGWYETDFKDKAKKDGKDGKDGKDSKKGQPGGDKTQGKKDDKKASDRKSSETATGSGASTSSNKSTGSTTSDSS